MRVSAAFSAKGGRVVGSGRAGRRRHLAGPEGVERRCGGVGCGGRIVVLLIAVLIVVKESVLMWRLM